jgi:hypothetical protein
VAVVAAVVDLAVAEAVEAEAALVEVADLEEERSAEEEAPGQAEVPLGGAGRDLVEATSAAAALVPISAARPVSEEEPAVRISAEPIVQTSDRDQTSVAATARKLAPGQILAVAIVPRLAVETDRKLGVEIDPISAVVIDRRLAHCQARPIGRESMEVGRVLEICLLTRCLV